MLLPFFLCFALSPIVFGEESGGLRVTWALDPTGRYELGDGGEPVVIEGGVFAIYVPPASSSGVEVIIDTAATINLNYTFTEAVEDMLDGGSGAPPSVEITPSGGLAYVAITATEPGKHKIRITARATGWYEELDMSTGRRLPMVEFNAPKTIEAIIRVEPPGGSGDFIVEFTPDDDFDERIPGLFGIREASTISVRTRQGEVITNFIPWVETAENGAIFDGLTKHQMPGAQRQVYVNVSAILNNDLEDPRVQIEELFCVAPTGGYCVKIRDRSERTTDKIEFSLEMDLYLLPENVSFYNIWFKEGHCPAILRGSLAIPLYRTMRGGPGGDPDGSHPAWRRWHKISRGSTNEVMRTDRAYMWFDPVASTGPGEYRWDIPWLYSVGGVTETGEITKMPQHLLRTGTESGRMTKDHMNVSVYYP